jgi:hypothetical protein
MSYRIPVLLGVFLFCSALLPAQVRYGFKTGLNFSNIKGPSEVDDAGNALESWDGNTGFHVGAVFNYNLSRQFGLRGEFLYSKKGFRYSYDGQSFRIFNYQGGSTLTNGTARYRINVNNAFIDIPVSAYGRFGDFELTAGAYVSFLVQSIGEGSLVYSGNTVPLNNPTGELKFILDHNYRKDNAVEGKSDEIVLAKVDARTLELPKSLGAYYDLPEDKGSLYNSLDYGLVAGLSYYLSQSMYAQVRLQYGLSDLTNNDADLSKARTDQGQLIYRDDKDHNFVIQVSIGFNF